MNLLILARRPDLVLRGKENLAYSEFWHFSKSERENENKRMDKQIARERTIKKNVEDEVEWQLVH